MVPPSLESPTPACIATTNSPICSPACGPTIVAPRIASSTPTPSLSVVLLAGAAEAAAAAEEEPEEEADDDDDGEDAAGAAAALEGAGEHDEEDDAAEEAGEGGGGMAPARQMTRTKLEARALLPPPNSAWKSDEARQNTASGATTGESRDPFGAGEGWKGHR